MCSGRTTPHGRFGLLLRHVRRRVGSGKHKSGSSSSRDRCIPRRFIPYNNFGTGCQTGGHDGAVHALSAAQRHLVCRRPRWAYHALFRWHLHSQPGLTCPLSQRAFRSPSGPTSWSTSGTSRTAYTGWARVRCCSYFTDILDVTIFCQSGSGLLSIASASVASVVVL
jgi:hypothetical protein